MLNCLNFVRLATFFVFFGRAWQFLFWDAPYRTFFWDESLVGEALPFLLGKTWTAISTNYYYDLFISVLVKLSGVLFLVCAILSISVKQHFKIQKKIIFIGGMNLVFLSLLLFKNKFWYIAQFIEYSAQMSAPFLLLSLLKKSMFNIKILLKIAMALTFIGHALFAIGFYPVPGPFIDMVINVFGFSEYEAIQFLKVMGCIDILASIALFIPRIEVAAIYFMAFWGGVTALARIVANVDTDFFVSSFFQWGFESVYRLPHMLLPLAILALLSLHKDRRELGA